MQSLLYAKTSDGTANASLMTVQTLRSPGATAILVNTVSGVPAGGFYASMGQPHTFTDPITSEVITVISDATAVDFAGHINAGQVIIDAIAPGYVDTRGSLVGDIIIIRPVSEWANNLFNVLNKSLNDDGSLKTSAITYQPTVFDHIASGAVLAGINYGTTLTASLGAGVCYINGFMQTIAAVATRTYTASKDTYVDALYSSTGTVTIVYTEVANNAASPVLAANSIRLGIVVTGASNIPDATYVNQGQETARWPQSNGNTVYVMTTDTLGNLIAPRDPNRRMLGKREAYSVFSSSSTSWAQITGLLMPIIVPTGRKIKLTIQAYGTYNSVVTNNFVGIFDGSLVDANRLQSTADRFEAAGASQHFQNISDTLTPTSASKTYLGGFKVAAGVGNLSAQARGANAEGGAMFIMAELE